MTAHDERPRRKHDSSDATAAASNPDAVGGGAYQGPLPLGGEALSSPLFAPAIPSKVAPRARIPLPWLIVGGSALISLSGVFVALLYSGTDSDAARVSVEPEPGSYDKAPALVHSSVRPKTVVSHTRSAPAIPAQTGAVMPQAPKPAQGATGAPVAHAQPAATLGAQAEQREQATRKPEARDERSDAQRRRARRAEARRARAAAAAAALPEQPTRKQVIAAMKRVQPAVVTCFGNKTGRATVSLTVVGRTGRVTVAQVKDQSGQLGSCIARAVRRARLPKFSSDTITISYPFAH